MARKPPVSQDARFHYEIWSGPSKEHEAQKPSISYVENHNADWDYGLASDDYKLATDALIAEQLSNPHLGNWTAPICHLIRQTMELQLKSLLQMIAWKTGAAENNLTFTHDLGSLWSRGRSFLIENGYAIADDKRLKFADRLVENLHAIDPAGDLFRFGTSKHQAFGKLKTYDRVGYDQGLLFTEFDRAHSCLAHWTSVIMRQMIAEEEGWTEDPYFDADDFPRDDPNMEPPSGGE
ncbi:hypothetical protein [Roseibium polysiphoniae]|uniref:Uncharacterized protein n=1 Tax=Roseibium polysiphoniae TaxID=2571221 RepID=A0ABR9C6B7_9HYPH|nr:hypothetical protein [Roseibium polysiphoniae]MBD8875123.1 hypothetical protein [Roseibium polysiphoniae]